MSNLNIRAIAPAGYVRACFSERARGFCLPAELVRRHLGAVNAAGVRRRLSREFAGYLVTEPGPVEVQRFCVGGGRLWAGIWGDAGGPLDAPDLILSGCMTDVVGEHVGAAVRRGWLS